MSGGTPLPKKICGCAETQRPLPASNGQDGTKGERHGPRRKTRTFRDTDHEPIGAHHVDPEFRQPCRRLPQPSHACRSRRSRHRYAIGLLPNDQDTYNTVFMTIVALLCMERIQFMASFAVTFAICDTGLFQPIGKAIQKIAQDELEIHVELDRAVLRHEMDTERGRTAFTQCRERIERMISEVVDSELRWIDYLFSEGRELVGMNAERLAAWTLYCARDVYQLFGLSTDRYTLPEHNPLRFMEKWLDISGTQASPQEQDIAAYKVGVMRRNDENRVFDVDF